MKVPRTPILFLSCAQAFVGRKHDAYCEILGGFGLMSFIVVFPVQKQLVSMVRGVHVQ